VDSRDIKPFWKKIFFAAVLMYSIGMVLFILINATILISELHEDTETDLGNAISMSDKVVYNYLNQFDYSINNMSIIDELVDINENRERYISFQKYRLTIEEKIKDFYFSLSGIAGVLYKDSNANFICVGQITPDVQTADIFDKVVDEYEEKQQSAWRSVSLGNRKYLAYYKNICYLDTSFVMHDGGKMVVLVDEEMVYRDTFKDTEKPGTTIFALDGFGKICCGGESEVVGKYFDDVFTPDDGFFARNDNNKLYYIKHMVSAVNGWKIVGAISISDIYYPIFAIISNSLLIFFIMLAIVMFIFYKISSYMNVPLIRLAKQLKVVENGNYGTIEQINDKTEIGYLYRAFNEMVSKLNEQFNENYILNIQIKEAYIKTLEQQINPHFIFNTLQLIQMMCLAGRTKDAFDVCGYFGEVVRFNLKEEVEVKIEDELENLRNYFKIIELRFYKQFEYAITVPDEIKELYVLKFLFQPIIENSMQHAFTNHKEKCKIDVLVRNINGEIVVVIKDNGDGMTEERVQEVTEYINDRSNISRHKSIGLKNSNQRIKLLYGEQFGIKIYSKQNKGTTILVYVPACKEKKYLKKEEKQNNV